ncbi:substrate-binding domain-containing protein, partial [Vibrio sp. 10N.261.55.A7]
FGILLKQASVSADCMRKQLLIADGHNQAESELKAVHSLVEKKCDVIVLYSRMLSSEQIIALNQSIDIPLVNVGRQLPSDAGYSIAFDQKNAIKMAVDHLIDLGHRDITYIGPKPVTPTSISRSQGFTDAIKSHSHLTIDTRKLTCEFGFIEGYAAGKEFAKQKRLNTSIVAASDDIATGCIKALTEEGIHVPNDVSIISIDNDPYSAFIEPALTTVEVPIKSIMAQAMLVAQKMIEGNDSTQPEILCGQLIVRSSTRPATL